ncbi:MAG: serine/threonine-protein kinase, partial [Dehalococcoidia bacterium]
MEQQIGESSRIGPYVLDAPIGKGGFATIWRGHHESTNQPVAVKILGNDVTGSYRAVQRAEIELLAAAAVRRTKHAVQVLDGGIQPFPHLVMEFVNGVDFAEVLRREGRLSIERTIEVAIAVADALSAMNEAGIIHRDLKPANVMLDGDGVIKLTDFGIAKIIGYETITAAGEIALTMAYAAPEVWDTDGPYGAPGHRSDLYALAIMLFEFLTGSTPFSGNYTTLYRSHRERRPDLTKLPGETPASLRLLLERCLEKNPDDRPRDADVCLKMLRRAEVELQESRGEKPRSEPQRFGPWERLRPHPTQPWAWLCRREEGDIATVELHFDTVAETGNRLRKAVAASAALAPLGAERLLETNRQLLRPGEDWT